MKKFLLIIPLALALQGCITTTVDGEYTGYVTAVEKTGLIFKTWDVYVKTDRESSQEDKFCVPSDEVAKQLKGFGTEKKRALIKFHDEFWTPIRCNVGKAGIVDSVEEIEE